MKYFINKHLIDDRFLNEFFSEWLKHTFFSLYNKILSIALVIVGLSLIVFFII